VKRLIGGEGFAEGKWPWLVSLQGKIPSRMLFSRIPLSYQRFYCGASLLNDRWILTAAHCFTETSLGSADLSLGAGFKGGRGPGHRPPTNGGPPTKPFIFYFSLMIDAYETTT